MNIKLHDNSGDTRTYRLIYKNYSAGSEDQYLTQVLLLSFLYININFLCQKKFIQTNNWVKVFKDGQIIKLQTF